MRKRMILYAFFFMTQIYLFWEIINIKNILINDRNFNGQVTSIEQEIAGIRDEINDNIGLIEVVDIPVGSNLVTKSNYELGNGWTYSEGTFNHASGYTNPLVIKFDVIPNSYYFAKFDTPTFSLPQDFTISVGNYLIENTFMRLGPLMA